MKQLNRKDRPPLRKVETFQENRRDIKYYILQKPTPCRLTSPLFCANYSEVSRKEILQRVNLNDALKANYW